MKTSRTLSTLAIAALSFTLVSCGGDTHESVMDDMVAEMGEVASILATATDKDSAEAAAKKLDMILPRLEAIAKRGAALEKPTPEEALALIGRVSTYQETMTKLATAQMALAQNPEAQAALGAAMSRFQNAMKNSNPFK